MVSNIDRIFEEITRQAEQAATTDFPAELLIELAMSIVDHEDAHRTKAININQKVENLIEQAANASQDS